MGGFGQFNAAALGLLLAAGLASLTLGTAPGAASAPAERGSHVGQRAPTAAGTPRLLPGLPRSATPAATPRAGAAPRGTAATVCVNPGGTGGCVATLQDAIDASAFGGTITVAPGTYGPTVATVNKDLTIVGAGAQTTIFDGQGTGRVITVNFPSTLALDGVTVTGGRAPTGAGISAASPLTLTNSVIRQNVADGGANFAAYGGGLEVNADGADSVITNSAVISNTSIVGTYQAPSGTVGQIGLGSGIVLASTGFVTITNSTVAGNTFVLLPGNAGGEAAIGYTGFNSGGLALINTTLANNTGESAGTSASLYAANAAVALRGSIVAGGPGQTNCRVFPADSLTSVGYNVGSDASCGLGGANGNLENATLTFGPLDLNGGTTPSLAPVVPNDALGRIPVATGFCPPTDQRGVARPQPGGATACDAGSVESSSVNPTPTASATPTATGTATPPPPPNGWFPLGTPTVGTNNTVYSLAELGGSVYAGGGFSRAGNLTTSGLARYAPGANTWGAVGTPTAGVPGLVLASLASGPDLYVGGAFNTAGGVTASNIARYAPATNTFAPLGGAQEGAVGGSVNALAQVGGDLYVGGTFHTAGGLAAPRVARYRPSTDSWSALGTSFVDVSNSVNALAVVGGELYAGGVFTQTAGIATNNLARYNPATGLWSPVLGGGVNGVNGEVFALLAVGTDLYAGGDFTQAGATAARSVARYSPASGTWAPLGTGATNGTGGTTTALATIGGDLFVGGLWFEAGGLNARNVARYAPITNTWSTLATGAENGVSGGVRALTAVGNDLYVGGTFTSAGGFLARNVARFQAPSVGPLRFISPVRVLDTRAEFGPVGYQPGVGCAAIPAGPLAPGSVTRFKVAGCSFGGTSVPTDTTGVLVNVTLVQSAPSGGFLTVFPGDAAAPPNASTVNPSTSTAANFWAVGLGAAGGANAGTLAVRSEGDPRHVLIDLVGYYAPSNADTPTPAAARGAGPANGRAAAAGAGNLRFVSPVRVLDTRAEFGPIGARPGAGCAPIAAGTVAPNQITRYQLAGCTFGGVAFPADVAGILAHVTTLQGTASGGFTTLLPGDVAGVPGVSTVNPNTGVDFNAWANGIPTSGPNAGTFGVYSTNAQDVLVDVVGYFAPSNALGQPGVVGGISFVTPGRVVDTRSPAASGSPATPIGFQPDGSPIAGGQLAPGSTVRYRLSGQTFAGGALYVPTDARGALVNATLSQAAAGGGFLTVFPGSDAAAPNASTVNPNRPIAVSFWATGLDPAAATNPGTLGVRSVGDPRDLILDLVGLFR